MRRKIGSQTSRLLAGLIVVIGLLATMSLPAAAQGSTAVTLEPPGALETFGRGINNNGDIVGWYRGGGQHGFLLRNGRYTQIDVPASWSATGTTALGINDGGTIVGSYFHEDADGNVHQHGYFLMLHGSFVKFDVPGATDTTPRSISDANVAGFFLDQSGNLHGFISVMNSGAVTIDFPGAVATQVGSINGNGDVTGNYQDIAGNVHGFVRSSAGAFRSFDVPGATVQPAATNAWAINDAGHVGGFDATSKSTALNLSEPRADLHGYVMTAGKFVTVNVPGGINTCIFGLNNAADAVGQYDTTDGVTHGFYMHLQVQ
jgi:hypothetical protein